MGHVFDVIKRTFEDNAIVLFIDLLGTTAYWRSSTPTEKQALSTIHALLGNFNIVFSNHFDQTERKDSFDVSIYADSIVISQRKDITNIIDRLVRFALRYQLHLLQKDELSRAIRKISLGSNLNYTFSSSKVPTANIRNQPFT